MNTKLKISPLHAERKSDRKSYVWIRKRVGKQTWILFPPRALPIEKEIKWKTTEIGSLTEKGSALCYGLLNSAHSSLREPDRSTNQISEKRSPFVLGLNRSSLNRAGLLFDMLIREKQTITIGSTRPDHDIRDHYGREKRNLLVQMGMRLLYLIVPPEQT
ncbi:hypothetical protein IFM89_034198 [Coptis chinensis]|uniref:Uncharacterized protein n=1 Tax=Coptis chinensis TaxID=261450 RepID=A0A835GZF0_9MAGN|nr:hypothetical protein IFM89_034198 [Coptis chinensis]